MKPFSIEEEEEEEENNFGSSNNEQPPKTIIYHRHHHSHHHHRQLKHLYVLPVLLLEFLALALTRAVLPSMLLHTFGDQIYFVMGCAECLRGLLAFISCPLFGKLSDLIGRRICLFITVLGTCLPVCSLAILPLGQQQHQHQHHNNNNNDNTTNTTATIIPSTDISPEKEGDWSALPFPMESSPVMNDMDRSIWIFVILLAISGIFSSTFTLTFAYISDTVKQKQHRVTAYGLALATFGLSFTIGPMAGGYLAKLSTPSTTTTTTQLDLLSILPVGPSRVFSVALILTILDLLYIYFILPESTTPLLSQPSRFPSVVNVHNNNNNNYNTDDDDTLSLSTNQTSNNALSERWHYITSNLFPQSPSSTSLWSPLDPLRIISSDPILGQIGTVAFLYYTSLYAVISTLVLYAAKRFHLSPEHLGILMSALGLATMISEAILIRIIVPIIGEKQTMRLGLITFTIQCIVLGMAYESWQLFLCVILSIFGNLVYPSLASLVSGAVAPEAVGEALGAINGIKSLTEGIGPLVFGTLMTMSEQSIVPGWPYFLAALLAFMAFQRTAYIPDENDEEYISERYRSNGRRRRRRQGRRRRKNNLDKDENMEEENMDEGQLLWSRFSQWLERTDNEQSREKQRKKRNEKMSLSVLEQDEEDEELEALLDDENDDENMNDCDDENDDIGLSIDPNNDTLLLPTTFLAFASPKEEEKCITNTNY